MPTCLVIMPFAVRDADRSKYPENHWREVYAGFLQPAVAAAGFECHRDDDDFRSRPISVNIWKKIETADIVLCDISSSNSNVFLELGWALRAEKPYVITMDELTTAPFDISDFNRFHYDHRLRPLTLGEEVPRLARMLSATLFDADCRWSVLANVGVASPKLAKLARPRCAVDIYYYESGFTRAEVGPLLAALQQHSIPYTLRAHSDPEGPDALFIGSMVEAADARLLLPLVPYQISFLFRPDYPEADGGDYSGYKVGIGYSSRYNAGRRVAKAEPVPINADDLKALVDPGHTNTSFQQLICELTLRRIHATS